jgi:thiamine-monophosphate kinase
MSTSPATEQRLIEIIRRAVRKAPGVRVGIGDDCAVLEPASGSLLLATTDLLIEDVHFRRRWATPEDIGWKSLAVNLSDIASMGGRPRWALIALACPETVEVEEAQAFYAGVQLLASEHDVVVVGGDTAASPGGWIVNVTLLGDAARAPITRSTANVGDVVAVTGSVGRSAAGLALLEAGPAHVDVAAGAGADVIAAHLRPRPRTREGQ